MPPSLKPKKTIQFPSIAAKEQQSHNAGNQQPQQGVNENDPNDDVVYENDFVGAGGGHGSNHNNQSQQLTEASRHRATNKSKLNLYLPNIQKLQYCLVLEYNIETTNTRVFMPH